MALIAPQQLRNLHFENAEKNMKTADSKCDLGKGLLSHATALAYSEEEISIILQVTNTLACLD